MIWKAVRFVSTLPIGSALQELAEAPRQGIRSGIAHISEYLNPHVPKDHCYDVRIIGGAIAPPWFYSVPRRNLEYRLGGAARVSLPHSTVVSVDGLPQTLVNTVFRLDGLFGIFSYTHFLDSSALRVPQYLVTHSLGGVVGLFLAALYPERIRKVFLVGTPLNPEVVSHPLVRFVMEEVVGIAPSRHSLFEIIREHFVEHRLLDRIEIIASTGDAFCSPNVCRIRGARMRVFREVPHIRLLHEAAINSHIAKRIREDYGQTTVVPFRAKRVAG